MSQDPFEILGRAIGKIFDVHDAKPPRFKNIARAYMGAGLLTACSYTAWWSQAFTGRAAGNLVAAFIRSPTQAPTNIWLPIAIWVAAAALGVLWFVVGVAGSRGPRDVMMIVWALVRLVIVAALLRFDVLPHAWPLCTLVLRGVYLSFLAAYAVEFMLLLPGAGGGPRGSNVHGQARQARVKDLRSAGIVQ